MTKVLRRAWIPIVIVIVVVVAGFTVHRVRTFFGMNPILVTPRNFADDAEPFNPKVVKYEIFGTGAYADINYLDLDAKPQRVDGAALPWSLTLRPPPRRSCRTSSPRATAAPSPAASPSTTRSRTKGPTDGVNAQTFCLVKSA